MGRLTHHGIYCERMRSTVGRNAVKRYDVGLFSIQRVNITRIRNLYNGTITGAFLIDILVLMEPILVRDGFLTSQETMLLFIRVMILICPFH